jgi:hypothetical protein
MRGVEEQVLCLARTHVATPAICLAINEFVFRAQPPPGRAATRPYCRRNDESRQKCRV